MQTLYIFDSSGLDDNLDSMLKQAVARGSASEQLLTEIQHNPGTGAWDAYTLPSEFDGLPEEVRNLYLFGVAFDNGWCMNGVYLVVVRDGKVEWISHA